MDVVKKWFSGNEAQQNTIDSILEDFRSLKLDECATTHEHIHQLMRIIESLKTLKEEMSLQNAQNLFLNNIVDPGHENIRMILKNAKRKSSLNECLQDIREREDDLE